MDLPEPSPSAPADPAHNVVLDRLQRPLHDLRVSVTDRCNFRCDYCMPAALYADERRFLPNSELLTFDEIERVVAVASRHLGVRKLRLTGGEPLLRSGLRDLIAGLSRLSTLDEIALTTNGYRLAEHAHELQAAGLTRVTVSLDTLNPDTFRSMSGGIAGLTQVLSGIEVASQAGLGPIKLNCVVVRGRNDSAIAELAEHYRGTPHIVRFIEYMDVGTQNGWRPEQVVSAHEIVARIDARWPLEAVPANYPGEVARRFRYADGGGEIGVIASVSAPFCGDCQRARLSADGRFLTCLFASDGLPLKPWLRNNPPDNADAALRALLTNTWSNRSDRYSQDRQERNGPGPRRRLEMYQIGG